jgi:O-methyltransferase
MAITPQIRNWLRDKIPQSALARIVRILNNRSGNWLNRLLYGKATYNQDGLVTAHFPSFLHDQRFLDAYAAGRATGSWPGGELHWRAHVICWAAAHAATLEGDFVECGVNRGGLSLTAMKFVEFERLGKRFFLLDTFEGLVEEQLEPGERQSGLRGGDYEPCFDAVVKTFATYGAAVKIVKGPVPATLGQVNSRRIAYLSIDMNAKEPELAAAEYFWDRLSPGAVVVLDDYGWRKHAAQRLAFDAFARSKGVPLLVLPTGQGLLIKPSDPT